MRNNVSFSQQVKEEIVNNEYNLEIKAKALLSAFIRINVTLLLQNRKTKLDLITENAKTAKFIYKLFNHYYQSDIQLEFSKKNNRAKKIVYHVRVNSDVDSIIEDLKIDFLEDKVSRDITFNDASISGYLAGAFLASGSVNSPKTSNYHLELCFNNQNFARWVGKLFNRFRGYQLEPKFTKRRDKYLVYFKKSDQISNFLVMIGAVNSCMEFESVRIDRDFVNSTIRLANFDTANMSRTIKTAKRQKEEILYLEEHYGLDKFKNPKVKMVCDLRKENDSISLE